MVGLRVDDKCPGSFLIRYDIRSPFTTVSIDILNVGAINIDHTIRGNRAPGHGQDVSGIEYRMICGGKAANHAVGSARLGARSAIIACAGRDEAGDFVEDALRREGVDTRWLARTDAAPTGRVLLHVDSSGTAQSMNVRGANDHLAVEHVPWEALAAAEVIVAQPLSSMELMRTIIDNASETATLILDPAPPEQLAPTLLGSFDIVKPNDSETEVLSGIRPVDQSSAKRAAGVLHEQGVTAVVIGASSGNLFSWTDESYWLPHLEVAPVDRTGAGDAMTAALAVGSLENLDRRALTRLAHAAAAVAVRRFGGQSSLGTRAEVDEMAARVQI